MFMFQNGLLATFIPEIIMVIAYLVCLIVPGNKQVTTSQSETASITTISNYHSNTSSTYSTYVLHFSLFEAVLDNILEPAIYFSDQITYSQYDYEWLLTKRLSFTQFSRPPPSIVG